MHAGGCIAVVISSVSRHPVGYEVLVCSKALLGVIMGVSWLILSRRGPGYPVNSML